MPEAMKSYNTQKPIDRTAALQNQRDTSSQKYAWDMHEAMKRYARRPVDILRNFPVAVICERKQKDSVYKYLPDAVIYNRK